MAVRAVLFDIDGTLVDSNGFHVEAWDAAFRSQGLEIARGRIAAEIGKGGDLLVPTLAPDADERTQAAITDHHDALFKECYLDRVKPFPQARALVERVHASGLRAVLASSASGEELEHYVGLLDVADLLHATTSKDDVSTSKPAPDIFAAAVDKAGVPADAVRAIGDSPYDIESAGKAGVATLAVLSGGFPRERLAGAEAIYADVADILARFDEALGG